MLAQGRMQRIAALHNGKGRGGNFHSGAGHASGAVERAKTHGLSGCKRLQRLAQKTLMVHIFTGLGQTFRRAQFRRQKKVVHVKDRTPEHLRHMRGQRAFSAAAAPVDGQQRMAAGGNGFQTRWASSRAGQASA